MNSFGSKGTLAVGDKNYEIFRLSALESRVGVALAKLPYSLKVLLENLLRQEDGKTVTAADIEFLANWDAAATPDREIAFMPARVLMQDFTGVPAIVDLAAMRDAMKVLGGDPEKINPLQPAELVIDHSVQVDEFGTANSYMINSMLEFDRNRERYAFLKWGQSAFRNFSAVPPGMGICHQVNLEYLARGVFTTIVDGVLRAYPDTLVGTAAGVACENGIVVDAYCRTSDSAVYAAGDCTYHPSLRYDMRVRLESVDNAFEQAKTAALNMLGKPATHDRVPWFWSDQFDNKLLIVGLSQGHDQQVTRGDPATRSFTVCYLKGGELVAVEAINHSKDYMAARRLIADRARPDTDKLADPRVALKDAV